MAILESEYSNDFKEFKRQFESQGYERLNGFDPAVIGALRGAELETAQSMLLDALSKGDHNALDALAVIGTPIARRALEDYFQVTAPPSMAHADSAMALYKITGDERYQLELLRDLEFQAPRDRVAIISLLRDTPYTPTVADRLLHICANDGEALARRTAARVIMEMAELASKSEKPNEPYLSIILGIGSEDPSKRAESIQKLKEALKGR